MSDGRARTLLLVRIHGTCWEKNLCDKGIANVGGQLTSLWIQES